MSDVVLDLDAIIDVAQLEAGTTVRRVAARGNLAPAQLSSYGWNNRAGSNPMENKWSAKEEDFAVENIGTLSLEEIGRRLGRSANAIKVHLTRMGVPVTAKKPTELSPREVAKMLGKGCSKTIHKLMKEGILEGRFLPTDRTMRAIDKRTLYRWMMNPDNWVYFNIDDVPDAGLRSLLQRRKERWGDEWWTPGQAATYFNLTSTGPINKRIKDGRLPGVRWGNWRVLRSDAMNLDIWPRGKNGSANWSSRADAFMILALALGLRPTAVAALMGDGFYSQRIEYRLRELFRRRMVNALIVKYKLPVKCDMKNKRIFADWREHRGRFPSLEKAVRRFLSGALPTQQEHYLVTGVLHNWLIWHSPKGENAKLKSWFKYCPYNNRYHIGRKYAELKDLGIDPFEGLESRDD